MKTARRATTLAEVAALTDDADPRFSLVIPAYNEALNVGPLLDEVRDAMSALGHHEVILVDDGSIDGTAVRAGEWKRDHAASWLRIARLESNRGQSAAVLAGVELARGPVALIMDGDRQNDPRDLERMLVLVESGRYQAVVGKRAVRRDSWVRRASSKVGNILRNVITGDWVEDSACGIKAFRRSLFLSLPRFNGMHRFMPTLARYAGAEVCQLEVNHRERAAGTAKYGILNRAFRGLFDCFAVRWYRRRCLVYGVKEEV